MVIEKSTYRFALGILQTYQRKADDLCDRCSCPHTEAGRQGETEQSGARGRARNRYNM